MPFMCTNTHPASGQDYSIYFDIKYMSDYNVNYNRKYNAKIYCLPESGSRNNQARVYRRRSCLACPATEAWEIPVVLAIHLFEQASPPPWGANCTG
jgi:hypothetical protein